jgi:hypothetical protein
VAVFTAEDSSTMKRIGVNVAVLVAVAFVLVAVTMLIT